MNPPSVFSVRSAVRGAVYTRCLWLRSRKQHQKAIVYQYLMHTMAQTSAKKRLETVIDQNTFHVVDTS
jgi:hypothetical protein